MTLGMFEAFLNDCQIMRNNIHLSIDTSKGADDGTIKRRMNGTSLQLVHTVLKSALLMMFRERITLTTRKLL